MTWMRHCTWVGQGIFIPLFTFLKNIKLSNRYHIYRNIADYSEMFSINYFVIYFVTLGAIYRIEWINGTRPTYVHLRNKCRLHSRSCRLLDVGHLSFLALVYTKYDRFQRVWSPLLVKLQVFSLSFWKNKCHVRPKKIKWHVIKWHSHVANWHQERVCVSVSQGRLRDNCKTCRCCSHCCHSI